MKMTPPSLPRNRSERMGWEWGSTALHTECTFGNTHPLTLGQLRVKSFCLPPQGMLRPHCTDRKHCGLNLQQSRQADHVQVSGCPRGGGEENGARAVPSPSPSFPGRLRSQSPPLCGRWAFHRRCWQGQWLEGGTWGPGHRWLPQVRPGGASVRLCRRCAPTHPATSQSPHF